MPPLFVPCPDGGFNLGGGANLANYPIRNTGADIGITFQQMIYDGVGDRLILAGDNDYIGSKINAETKLQQAPSLPVVTSVYNGIAVRDSGEFLIANGNDIFLGDSDLDNWSDITAPALVTRPGVFTIAGSTRIYVIVQDTPAEIEFSDDNGLTWSSGATNLIVTGSLSLPRRNALSRDRSAMAIGSSATISYALSGADIDAENWTTLALIDFLGINPECMAWSDDKSRIVIAAANGSINHVDVSTGTISTYALADNLFRQTAANGAGPDFIAYVPSLSGFVAMRSSLDLVAFLPDSAPLTMEQGIYLGDTPTGFSVQDGGGVAAVDSNGTMLAAGLSNRGVVFPRSSA